MEDLFDRLTQGNVTTVKTVLASAIMAVAVYQVLLMLVGFGKVRVRWLRSGSASFAHRAIGDATLLIAFFVALLCLTYFDLDDGDDQTRLLIHAIAGSVTLGLFVLKVIVVQWGTTSRRFLPVVGSALFASLAVTWFTSAGETVVGG